MIWRIFFSEREFHVFPHCGGAQCRNSRIFLPLRFYVESILVCRNSETAILSKKIFCKSISRMLKFVKFKIQRLSNGKYDTFWNRRSTEIDFMWNILVSYTTLNALVGAGRSWVRILLKGWNFFFHFYVDMQFIAPSSGTNKHYECISSLLHSKTLLKIAFF